MLEIQLKYINLNFFPFQLLNFRAKTTTKKKRIFGIKLTKTKPRAKRSVNKVYYIPYILDIERRTQCSLLKFDFDLSIDFIFVLT